MTDTLDSIEKMGEDTLRRQHKLSAHGINVGNRYLDGAFNYDDYAAGDLVNETFASDLVWLDAFVTNPDRTHRNPNLMIWQGTRWLIDHGTALYAQHSWHTVDDVKLAQYRLPM